MAFCTHKNVIVDEFRFKINQLLQLVDLYATEQNTSRMYLEKVRDIKIHFLNHNDTLEDLCYTEKKLIGLAPDVCLKKYYLQLTSRYKEILPKESSKYLSKEDFFSGKILNATEILHLREETLYISGLLHKYYHFLDNKEKVIAKYKMLFILLLLIMFVVSAISFAFSVVAKTFLECSRIAMTSNAVMLVIAMICAGYFGAVISVVRRIQCIAEKSVDGVDREDLLLKLVNGKWGIFLSIILGTLAPFVLLLLLIMFQNTALKIGDFNLLPQIESAFEKCLGDKPTNVSTTMSIIYDLKFRSLKDVAEFILLSIACGFSERFIPDVLDRVSKELEQKVRERPAPNHQDK